MNFNRIFGPKRTACGIAADAAARDELSEAQLQAANDELEPTGLALNEASQIATLQDQLATSQANELATAQEVASLKSELAQAQAEITRLGKQPGATPADPEKPRPDQQAATPDPISEEEKAFTDELTNAYERM